MSHTGGRQITLRGLPSQVLQEIRKEARRKKTSLNKVLLERIAPSVPGKSKGACAELLPLAGSWNRERAEDFEHHLKDHRQIDEELWS